MTGNTTDFSVECRLDKGLLYGTKFDLHAEPKSTRMATVSMLSERRFMLAQWCLLLVCVIVFALGGLHAWLTIASEKFSPRDDELKARLQVIAPRISKQTTMWRAGLGFHLSHSLGAMLFAAVYGYLAWFGWDFLMEALFLRVLGLVYLLVMLVLAVKYWFRIPVIGLALSSLMYVLSQILN